MSFLNTLKHQPQQKAPVQKTKTIRAPIGGLNAKDSIGNMPEGDAYGLVNWIPQALGLKLRNGYMAWSSGIPSPVQSVFQYFAPTSTVSESINYSSYPTTLPGTVFAATKDNIYNVTTQGAVGAAVRVLGGATRSGHICANMFVNAGGNFLILNSEADGYYTYDGAVWLYVTAGAGPTQINGVNPNNLVFNLPWKNRIFFVEKNTSRVWYTGVNALYGAVTAFDFGPLMKHGGAISYIADWTIDAGTGVDDMFVVVGENGDVLVYKGTDPSAAATFALVGTWYVGEVPKGRRSFTQYGGDLLILSTSGLFPLSYITRGGAALLQASDQEYTSKIQQKINVDLGASFNLYGWEVMLCARENLLIITVPNYGGSTNKQYVMSTITNMWTTFSGMPISAMDVASGFLLSADALGAVNINFVTTLDAVAIDGTGGIGITGFSQPAFTYMDVSAYKHFLMARPTLLSKNAPAISVQMNTDFNSNAPISVPAVAPSVAALWDSGKFDVAVWGGDFQTFQSWIGVSGAGFAGSLAMYVVGEGGTQYMSTDYMYEVGGPI